MLDADLTVPRRHFDVVAAFAVGAGERLALFGPSGGGKSTILETLAGLVPLARGRISLGGRVLSESGTARPVAVPPWDRGVVLLRQDPALFPHKSVGANLAWAGSSVDWRKVLRLVDALELGGLLGTRPRALSGGQAQRVALVRALAARRDALLLDEPYRGLDARLSRQLTDLLCEEVSSGGQAAILVAHELSEAQAFADRIAVLDAGRLLQVGRPDEVVRRPASRRVAELVGYRGFVPAPGGATAAVHPDRVLVGRPPSPSPDRAVVLDGVVARARPWGASWELEVRVGPAPVSVRAAEALPPGSPVALTLLDPPRFGPDGAALPATWSGRPSRVV